MSFTELVGEVARATGMPRAVVRQVLTAFKVEAKKVLESGEKVVLPSFGTFFARDLPAKRLFGGARVSEGRRSIRFRESRR